MIANILLRLSSQFSRATKNIHGQSIPELPFIEFATKPKPQRDEDLPMSVVYDTLNYKRHMKQPSCRYFSLQWKGRIYHFYNAYYYPLGRMLDRVATAIRGRNSPHYRNHQGRPDRGDICVIVNIEDPLITGKKLLFKQLVYHTGFVGHLRSRGYKYVLNHKPQLLYHFLLRKVMPKNKLSKLYFDNVKLYRGPVHDLKWLPQFAPDHRQYSAITNVDLLKMVKDSPDIRIAQESHPGAAEQIIGKKVQRELSERQRYIQDQREDEAIEDLSNVYEQPSRIKTIPNISKDQYEVLKRKEKRIQDRYRTVRAPYIDKKAKKQKGLELFTSEKKARKDPRYDILNNEEFEETDEEHTCIDPHIKPAGSKNPKK